ncbi:MAG: ribosomal protein S18-alanine N-acetyltransferase [Candidatus Izimaplasma sp.]|nr:ribosomal protein S18-alanine N-acetyltransferase [Candidatus Izimaplasma bacterium]
MNVKIRKADENDIEFLHKYENLYFNETTKSGITSEIFNNPLIFAYVMLSKNVYIGYTIIWLDEDKSQIYSLVIVPEKRNRGYAKALLSHLFEFYKLRKIKEITLEVRKTNIKAINLYKSFGFKSISIKKNYYNDNEDALFLYKKL